MFTFSYHILSGDWISRSSHERITPCLLAQVRDVKSFGALRVIAGIDPKTLKPIEGETCSPGAQMRLLGSEAGVMMTVTSHHI